MIKTVIALAFAATISACGTATYNSPSCHNEQFEIRSVLAYVNGDFPGNNFATKYGMSTYFSPNEMPLRRKLIAEIAPQVGKANPNSYKSACGSAHAICSEVIRQDPSYTGMLTEFKRNESREFTDERILSKYLLQCQTKGIWKNRQ